MDVLWPVRAKHDVVLRGYRLGIFHVGNNMRFHGDIYRLANSHPGLVVLHDLGLDDLVRGLVAAGDPLGYRAWREASVRSGRITLPESSSSEPLRWPWCADLVRHARGVIVHSEFCRRYLEDFGCLTPVFVVPHPRVERPSDLLRAEPLGLSLRARTGLGPDDVLVVAPGDLNAAKQLPAVLAAVARLEGVPVHVALVGRRIPGFDAEKVVSESGIAGRVTLAPDVTDDEFRGWLVASDILVDLRHPHRGEVSGSLIRGMQAGRPVIVSATGTYLDIPEDAVVRVVGGPVDPDELAGTIRELARDRERRRRLGSRAREHVEGTMSEERTAQGYEEAVEQTLELLLDPRRLALARWAKALNDLSFRDSHLLEGFGLSYARGLDELAAAIERKSG